MAAANGSAPVPFFEKSKQRPPPPPAAATAATAAAAAATAAAAADDDDDHDDDDDVCCTAAWPLGMRTRGPVHTVAASASPLHQTLNLQPQTEDKNKILFHR